MAIGTNKLYLATQVDLDILNDEFNDHEANADIHFSASERNKLSGIEEGANKTVVDSSLSSSSANPVENRVVQSALTNSIANHNTSSIAHNDIRTSISNLETSINSISENKVSKIDIIDNLTTNLSTKPLAASQGVILNNSITTLSDEVSDHIDNSDIHFTASERTKLSGIATGANKTVVDTSLSTTSTNPVENQAVTNWLADNVKNYYLASSGSTGYAYLTSDPTSAIASATSDDGSGVQSIYALQTANGDFAFGTQWGLIKDVPTTLSGYGITDAETKGTATSTVNTHNTSSSAHNDIRLLISNLTTQVNNFLDVDDTTKDQLSELIVLIEENADDIESITSGKVNVSDIVNNLTTNVSNKPLSAAQGVAIKALIDALQSALDTDEAALATHTGNTTVHITAAERTNWNDAVSKEHTHSNKTVLDNTTASYTTAEKTKLSGIAAGAEVNQNAFASIIVGSTEETALTKTSSLEFTGHNIQITTGSGKDSDVLVGFSVPEGSTTGRGIVQLTNSTSSTSTTTAATPSSVKSAYDLANTAKTNAATAQAAADAAADNSIVGLSASGRTVTYTKGDGSTGTITTQDTVYTHPSYTARTGVPTANQTPAFGGTFTVSQPVSDASGHITAINSRTITIPGTAAGTALGLVKSGGDVTIADGVITVKDDSHAHTIANVDNLQSTLDSKLPLAGGNMTGHIYLTGSKASSSTGNTSQLIFGTSSSEHVAISSNDNALVVNPTSSSTENQIVLYLNKQSLFPMGISAGNLSVSGASTLTGAVDAKSTITIGSGVTLQYDSTNECLDFVFA